MKFDCLPFLELWDLIVSVFRNISRISDRTVKPVKGEDKHHKFHNKIDAMKDIDSVPSNVQSVTDFGLTDFGHPHFPTLAKPVLTCSNWPKATFCVLEF